MAFVEGCSRGDMLAWEATYRCDDVALFTDTTHAVVFIPHQASRRIDRVLTTPAGICLNELQFPQVPPIHLM